MDMTDMKSIAAKMIHRKWSAGLILGVCCFTLAGCVSESEYYETAPTYNRAPHYQPYYSAPRYERPRYEPPRYERPRYEPPRYDRSRFDRDGRPGRDDVRPRGEGRDDDRDRDPRRPRRVWMQDNG
jgi:hypothetical protein